jgi:hypothetical protein
LAARRAQLVEQGLDVAAGPDTALDRENGRWARNGPSACGEPVGDFQFLLACAAAAAAAQNF